jgi:hypothetical protein
MQVEPRKDAKAHQYSGWDEQQGNDRQPQPKESHPSVSEARVRT